MRYLAATAAALGFVALALVPIDAVDAADEDATPHLLTPQELRAPNRTGAAPLILRGSVAQRQPAAEVELTAPSWQIVAGRRLWVVNPATEDVRTCAVRDTTQVGVQEIRCLSGSTSRYRRTFGANFAP